MRQHLLFTSIPAHGHVAPTLPVVEELVSRGHRVTYSTHEMFRAQVEAAGAALLPVGGEDPPVAPSRDFRPEQLAGLLDHLVGQARISLPLQLDHLRQDPVDAVCYDAMTFTGGVLADRLAVPAVALFPSLASNEHFSMRERVLPAGFDPTHPVLGAAFQRLHAFVAEHGVRTDRDLMGTVTEALNIVFVPRRFQIAGETFDQRFCFVGPSLGERVTDSQWRPRGEGPLLFVSLGTAFNKRPEFFRACLRAFGDSPWQVAMAVGTEIDQAELGPLPANVEMRPYFPQLAVLEHATAFVSHGGMNSTMESLHFGVPLVAVPQMGEQQVNAERVAELGLGRCLTEGEWEPERLRAAVEQVAADETIRGNLTEMSKIVRDAGGAVAAAEAIENHLGR